MITKEFRQSLDMFDAWLIEEGASFDILHNVEKTLLKISNHIAVCHRVIAETRVESKALIPTITGASRQLLLESERAGSTLEDLIALQSDCLDFKVRLMRKLYNTNV